MCFYCRPVKRIFLQGNHYVRVPTERHLLPNYPCTFEKIPASHRDTLAVESFLLTRFQRCKRAKSEYDRSILWRIICKNVIEIKNLLSRCSSPKIYCLLLANDTFGLCDICISSFSLRMRNGFFELRVFITVLQGFRGYISAWIYVRIYICIRLIIYIDMSSCIYR